MQIQPTRAPAARPIRRSARYILPFLLAGAAIPAPGVAAQTGSSVLIAVNQVRDAHGHVRVALCTRQTFLTQSCPYHASAPAAAGTVSVRIDGVSPGTYSVEAFHDDDDTRRLERSFFGLPTKGMGFSREAAMRFGPPRFDDAAFRVVAADAAIAVVLHYY